MTSFPFSFVLYGRVLSKHDIRGMPVVNESGKVVGLISYKEVNFCLAKLDKRTSVHAPLFSLAPLPVCMIACVSGPNCSKICTRYGT